jgi:hypothetical protein
MMIIIVISYRVYITYRQYGIPFPVGMYVKPSNNIQKKLTKKNNMWYTLYVYGIVYYMHVYYIWFNPRFMLYYIMYISDLKGKVCLYHTCGSSILYMYTE